MVRTATAFLAGAALLGARAALAQTTIQSPALYQCTPASFQYTCAAQPCSVVARPSDDPTSQVADLGQVTAASGALSWTVSVPEGTRVTIYITDNNGAVGNGAPTTVSGGSSSCLSGDAASSSSAADPSSASSAESVASSQAASSASQESSAASQSASASNAESSAASSASSVASSAASRAPSAASAASSVASATGAAPSASATGDSGAASLVFNGALTLIAGVAVVRLA
ncbi:hypothetical protein DMC30DRAFT_416573 [Rhodotorula diobovata]|uniref:Uncharacterized protein n=1 Tax=Rhodotorula diobovata TaxID=5288 RepID=A0A5C5FX31_9BASI|nr:hypothetical protein DMC30DRAFT_416573 [Rhodotorula diobovata]